MIPINQTRLYTADASLPPGNCFQACLASIFEVPITEVPDEEDTWKAGMGSSMSWCIYIRRIYDWLAERNLAILNVTYADYSMCLEDVYHIVSGPSPRNNSILHAVVGKGVDLVHDPHPDKTMLDGDLKDYTYEYFVIKDPSKPNGLYKYWQP